MLAPHMRLQNRMVRKTFNGVSYYGKITDIRKDTDGVILYGVVYSDSDYDEYSFCDIMKLLQPYNPVEDDNDVLEITPFFGFSKGEQ